MHARDEKLFLCAVRCSPKGPKNHSLVVPTNLTKGPQHTHTHKIRQKKEDKQRRWLGSVARSLGATTTAPEMSKPSRYSNRVLTVSGDVYTDRSMQKPSTLAEKPPSYEGPCHRCNKLGHKAKDCSKPRICGKCGQKGHVERECNYSSSRDGSTASNQKKKKLQFRSVCKRCGQRGGHASSKCPNVSRCKICTENHETRDCPRNLGGNMSKKRREIEEQISFIEQRRQVVMMEEGGRREGVARDADDEIRRVARKKVKLVRVKRDDDKEKNGGEGVKKNVPLSSTSVFEQAKEENQCMPLVDYASSSDE